MPELTDIAVALGLPGDSTETAILDRINTITPDGDVVTLSADEAAELMRQAAAGQAATVQLAEDRFQTAWDRTVTAGRAVPAQESLFRRIYDQDPDLAIRTLDSLTETVPTVAKGETGDDGGDMPDGQDPQRVELDRAASRYAEEHNVSYLAALDKVADKVLGG